MNLFCRYNANCEGANLKTERGWIVFVLSRIELKLTSEKCCKNCGYLMSVGYSSCIEFFVYFGEYVKFYYCSLDCQEKMEYDRLLKDEQINKIYSLTDQENRLYRVKKLINNGERTIAYKYI